jgi:hypothetical protein
MSVYGEFENIDGASIKERIAAFRETVTGMIAEGKSIEEMRNLVDGFEDDEMYEAAKGVMDGISAFQKKPQTRLAFPTQQ